MSKSECLRCHQVTATRIHSPHSPYHSHIAITDALYQRLQRLQHLSHLFVLILHFFNPSLLVTSNMNSSNMKSSAADTSPSKRRDINSAAAATHTRAASLNQDLVKASQAYENAENTIETVHESEGYFMRLTARLPCTVCADDDSVTGAEKVRLLHPHPRLLSDISIVMMN